MSVFPHSLEDLRAADSKYQDTRFLWDPLEPFFLSHGLTLWPSGPDGYGQLVPPDSRPRAPDGFSYRWPGDIDRVYDFILLRATLCPARTVDGRDVVIRIVSIGDDGAHHRMAMERLSTGNIASVIGNHTIPVLQWLRMDDIVFAVLPYLSGTDPTTSYLYQDVQDLLNHLLQMTEGVAFCHSKLVAHQDLFHENFLCNFYGGAGIDASYCPPPRGHPVRALRSRFPFKLYVIDFDRAVCFDEDSDPASRRVTGLPALGHPEHYARPIAPEMESDEPYDPFAADVWQLGTYICDLKDRNNTMPECLVALLDRMTAITPSDRPDACEALDEMRDMLSKLTAEELLAPVWRDPRIDQDTDDEPDAAPAT